MVHRQAQRLVVVVPTVVPSPSFLLVAGRRSPRLTPSKHNGQRWRALAVPDYESRALPLSYGGAVPNLAGCGSPRYSTAMGRHSSARRKGATIYPPFRGGGSEPRPTTSRTARSNSADENGFLRLVAAPNSSAALRRSSRPGESPPDTTITFTPGDSFRIRRTVTIPSCPGMKMSVIRASRAVLRTASSSSIRMIRAIVEASAGQLLYRCRKLSWRSPAEESPISPPLPQENHRSWRHKISY